MDALAPPTDEQLRRALELALMIVVQGQKLRPPLTVPAPLRPFLRFQKLPSSALPAVRRAVEEDDSLRRRAASVATDEVVGPIGALWLARPEGWEEEVARLAHEELAAAERDEAGREERGALKRLEAVEQALARTRADLAAAAAELGREREKRQAAEARLNEVIALQRGLDEEVEQRRAEVRRLKDQLTASRAALEEANEARRVHEERRSALAQRLEEALRAKVEAEARAVGAVAPSNEGPAVRAAAGSLRDAAAALARLASALGDTATALGTDTVPRPPASPAGRRSRPTRVPLSIPGGLYADAPEVAAYLLRVPDVVVVVDGYNVAKTGWPDLELATQRERLFDALDDVVRRVGTRFHVVFDGADVVAPPTGRRLLHVRFSPPGVLADDVIREFVAEQPAEQAVVVVTSDNAVVASVRAMGANTVSSAQFLAGLSR